MTGYYLATHFFLWRSIFLAGSLVVSAMAGAQTQPSQGASVRGEAYEKCKSFFSGAVQELPDSDENNAFLNSCGWRFYDYHELPAAGKAFAQASAMAERRHDQGNLADALDGSANVDRLSGNFGGAEQVLQQALRIAEEIQNKDELSKIYLSFGRLRGDQGREEEACDSISRALQLLQELDRPLQTAIANNNLGTCFLRRGDYGRALQSFEQSLAALQQIHEDLKSATVLDNIGQCYWRLGDFSKAIETFNQSLGIREKYKDGLLIGKSLDSLGNVYLLQGNYAAALDSLQQGFELRTKAGFPYDATESLNNIATVYEAQGEYAQAVVYLRRALQNAEKLENKDLVAEIDTHLGEVYSLKGDSPQAYVALRHALDNSRAADDKVQLADAQYALGRAYLKDGRLSLAKAALDQARDFYQLRGLILALGNTLVELSEVERHSGHLQEGLALATRAADLGERIGSPELRWRSMTALGRLNAGLGHRDEAAKSFDDAIGMIEEERTRVAGGEENRARFFSERVTPYQERIAIAISSGKTDDALSYAERSKARVLLDVIGADRIPLTTAMSDAERERETKLRTALASLNSQILVSAQANPPDEKRLAELKKQREEARLQYEDFESTLFSGHPELAFSRGTVPIVRAAEAKALLSRPSAGIVEYALVKNRTWAFVITTRDVHVFELRLSNAQLQQEVERFRQRLAQRDVDVSEPARQLYQEVLGLARAYLKDKTELVLIPDGVLWDLPFQALQPEAGHYLIEDSAISYAPSLTALHEMMRPRSHPPHQSTLIAFGNPKIGVDVVSRRKMTLMDESLAPLPETEIQAKSVAQIYTPESRVYLGSDAREDRWKAEAPGYRIVHLATHGVLDNRSPLYSYLVLTPSDDPKNADDGLLEAWEIMRTHLNADLVVLSACETARGTVFPGEAVIGLTWAFFVAGSPATLVSQWKVESASSTALMTDFHDRWKGGRTGLSKARALQAASVQMLHSPNYSHPFYWAGYILVGNGR
jgi:CHAT domain-containing protein/Tfp pilus assembly protein PilF